MGIYYHRPMRETSKDINFVDLASGSLSRFLFSISLALAAVFTGSMIYLGLFWAFAVIAVLSWNGSVIEVARIARFAAIPFIFIFFLHLFSHEGDSLFHLWILSATLQGAEAGIFYGLKLLVFAFAAGIILLAVDPFDLVSPLERIARHSGRAGRPFGALALALFLAIRFIPELARQSRLTLLAFETRGLDMKGSFGHKAKVALLMIAPMFVNGFKRADLAAAALSIKGYSTRYSRGVLGPARITLGSVITLSISVIFLIAGWHT
jgi:energy-coupling factor transporter transmembrane protein EcfT